MTDIYDQATAREEQDREIALQHARSAAVGPAYTGFCLNCDVITHAGHRWCCPECRDDWYKRAMILKRKGGGNASF